MARASKRYRYKITAIYANELSGVIYIYFVREYRFSDLSHDEILNLNLVQVIGRDV